MEILIVVLLCIVLIMLIRIGQNRAAEVKNANFRLAKLEYLLEELIKKQSAPKPEASKAEPPKEAQPRLKIEPKPTVFEQPEPATKPQAQPGPSNVEWFAEVITPPQQVKHNPPPAPKSKEPQPTFFERYPDLEKFIGENLINKIGIAILVLTIGFFVKFAIDNNWIGPVGRVGVGVLCGAILVVIAHRLRKNYKAFSSVLVGGGLAVFYFTITLAFHQFHLFGQTAAFIILIGITVFAVVLSMLYDRQELAIIALIGGFSSPFMVSTGQANYSALFIYLAILNAGLLVIAYNKLWRILNIVSFGLTVVVYASVLYTLSAATYHIGFWFGTLFYLMYFCINIAYNVRQGKSFVASDFSILLINTALYFAAGLYLLTQMNLDLYRGLFSAALGALNLVLSYILFRNKKADTNVLYLLIGITLTLISLTAPIQLHGHYITLFWEAEAVLLLWLYKKSNIRLMQITSVILWIAMLTSLLMDWWNVYGLGGTPLTIIANKGFITALCAGISSYLLFVLADDKADLLKGLFVKKSAFRIIAFILFYLAGALEINFQFGIRYPVYNLQLIYLLIYTAAFLAVFNFFAQRKGAYRISFILSFMLLIGYLFLSGLVYNVQAAMLTLGQPNPVHFVAHWAAAIFMAVVIWQMIKAVPKTRINPNGISWVIFLGVVIFLSVEFCMASNGLFYKKGTDLEVIKIIYIKTALPVLWGLLSFAMMWIGMDRKNRMFRIISLSLFSLTLIKLFIYDISDIPAAGKIVAFFCLGVLLLIISFMYQKVKKIIVDDEKPKDGQ